MNCDKCGMPVEKSNDATIIEAYAFDNPVIVLFNQSRHFLPVYDNSGNMVCEGSPSRAQYVKGQPKDKRGYKYQKEYESNWRKGYKLAQESE